MSDTQTLTLVLAIAGFLIAGLLGVCTRLILRAHHSLEDKLGNVSDNLLALATWCSVLAGRFHLAPPKLNGD